MKTKTRITVTGTKIIGVAPITNIVGETFDAEWDQEAGYYYIHSQKHGGRIRIRPDECQPAPRREIVEISKSEHAALVAVAEAAAELIKRLECVTSHTESVMTFSKSSTFPQDLRESLAQLAAVRSGSEVAK